jgi:lipopolysaccharide/colanic/teichoic acid biosynthesis glycosyltransferase
VRPFPTVRQDPENRYRERTKPWIDRAALVLTSPVTVPIGLLVAAAVRVSSGSPIFFRQNRVGRSGRDFEMLKFRTMTNGDNPVVPDPDRITAIGKVLRRTSLDELPQLINVWRGEMSLVGPRPTLRYQVDRYDDTQRRRLDVAPGLTGLAQVSGRNSLGWSQRIDADLEYVNTCSLGLDLRIIGRTFAVVLTGQGIDGHNPEDPLVAGEDTR